jgi:hypothetical protein
MFNYFTFILFVILFCQLTHTDALKCNKLAKKSNKTTAIIRNLKMVKKATPKYIHMSNTASNCSEFFKLNHLTSCCLGRNDECYMNYYGSRCYCDIFCLVNNKINKHNDCCPDAVQTCQYNPDEVNLSVVTSIDVNGQISHKILNESDKIKNEIHNDKELELSRNKHGNFKNKKNGGTCKEFYSLNNLTSCCLDRNDDCFMFHYDTRCYCDEFCRVDCCVDVFEKCSLKISMFIYNKINETIIK